MSQKPKSPSSDYVNALTSIGSILLSISFTHVIVIVLRSQDHEVLLPLLIIIGGMILAATQFNREDSQLFHSNYLSIWLCWIGLWCFRTELEQHESKITLPPQYNQACHLASYLLCLAWPKVVTLPPAVRTIYCALLFTIMAGAEDGPLSPSWLIYEQLFSYAFVYFFASFFTESPEFCAVWTLFFDYPITLFTLSGLQIIAYIGWTLKTLPDIKTE